MAHTPKFTKIIGLRAQKINILLNTLFRQPFINFTENHLSGSLKNTLKKHDENQSAEF